MKKSRVGIFEKTFRKESSMEVLISAIIGFFLGVLLSKIVRKPKSIGVIRVDHSDPSEAPYLFLELNTGVESVINQKYVTFEVNVQNYISHE
jgi:hypothetical protein